MDVERDSEVQPRRELACGSMEFESPPFPFPPPGESRGGRVPPRRQKRAAPPTRGLSNRSAEPPPLCIPPVGPGVIHPGSVYRHPIIMEDRELYRRILGIEHPCSVASVDLQLSDPWGPAHPAVRRVWRALQTLPPPTPTPMAPPRHLPVPHHPARRPAAQPMPHPRRAYGEVALGRALQPLYRAV